MLENTDIRNEDSAAAKAKALNAGGAGDPSGSTVVVNDMSNNLQGSQTSKYAIYASTNITGTGSTIYVNNSASTTTLSTNLFVIVYPTAVSGIRLTSNPSCFSSNAVNLEPC